MVPGTGREKCKFCNTKWEVPRSKGTDDKKQKGNKKKKNSNKDKDIKDPQLWDKIGQEAKEKGLEKEWLDLKSMLKPEPPKQAITPHNAINKANNSAKKAKYDLDKAIVDLEELESQVSGAKDKVHKMAMEWDKAEQELSEAMAAHRRESAAEQVPKLDMDWLANPENLHISLGKSVENTMDKLGIAQEDRNSIEAQSKAAFQELATGTILPAIQKLLAEKMETFINEQATEHKEKKRKLREAEGQGAAVGVTGGGTQQPPPPLPTPAAARASVGPTAGSAEQKEDVDKEETKEEKAEKKRKEALQRAKAKAVPKAAAVSKTQG